MKYQLTPEGMSILTQRTLQYLKRSLTVNKNLRQKAKAIVIDLRSQGVTHVCLEGRMTGEDGGRRMDGRGI